MDHEVIKEKNMAVTKARAYANGAVALIFWDVDQKLDGCLGFEIIRRYKNSSQPDRVLASWVAFEGQSNKDWTPMDTSVWPVQRLMWRDLTLRQKRDQAALNPLGTTVFYSIRPVGAAGALTPDVPAPATKPYEGDPIPLRYLGDAVETNEVYLTTKHGCVTCGFTNGILSTQFLVRAFEKAGIKLDPQHLKAAMKDQSGDIRAYLAGDALTLIKDFFQTGDGFNQALYELEDEELIALLKGLGGKTHLILSNTSNNAKRPDPADWDSENRPQRQPLRNAGVDLTDRMFNNERIGHNKYSIRIEQGRPQAILTGSTNWTTTGLCAQSNNAILVESPDLAQQYLDYWQRLKVDTGSFANPSRDGAGTSNSQGPAIRKANNGGFPPVTLGDGTMVQAWFSPNTIQKTKPPASKPAGPPPDLADVFSQMRKANNLILFAVFMPSQGAKGDVVRQAIDLGENDHKLLVYGSLSDPTAMPNYAPKDRNADEDDRTPEQKQPHIYDNQAGNVHLVRATAIDVHDHVGDFEGMEMLKSSQSAHAIIHDKIVVVDPLDDTGFVAMGSHNLGAKASYENDENLLIIRNNKPLVMAYAVHLMDLWDHYRFRAYQALKTGGERFDGFLQTKDSWMDDWLASDRRSLVEYFLR